MHDEQFMNLMREFAERASSLEEVECGKLYAQVVAFSDFIMASQGAGPVAVPINANSSRFNCPKCHYIIDVYLR
ncbi:MULTISPECIES: hypothetical protein [unclassified Halomonas]|uniref:hypothetical protein n=1 Tax=unclassified Halomonas TaxID=2609666 RepID=UPI0005FC3CAB|nr:MULTISPECIES: hypothetical protein [unclassified Halomonas]CEP34122.1 Putative uncharacterized protein [Halomonas sp. R57-5]